MIKSKQEHTNEIIIDLTGPEGNAFYLLAFAKNAAEILEIDPKPIIDEMKSGDYEHLVQTLDLHFGSFVTLLR